MEKKATPATLLPPPGTLTWGARRKAVVIRAVREGILSLDQACERYLLSREEYAAWEAAFDRYGERGLQIKSRPYKRRPPRPV